jgi:hypothetical protein
MTNPLKKQHGKLEVVFRKRPYLSTYSSGSYYKIELFYFLNTNSEKNGCGMNKIIALIKRYFKGINLQVCIKKNFSTLIESKENYICIFTLPIFTHQ